MKYIKRRLSGEEQVWAERPRVGVSVQIAARKAGSNPARLKFTYRCHLPQINSFSIRHSQCEIIMRISAGQGLRSWNEWVHLAQEAQKMKSEELRLKHKAEQQQVVLPLNSNVVGGPLDGAEMPAGTRKGLKYEWYGQQWRYVC